MPSQPTTSTNPIASPATTSNRLTRSEPPAWIATTTPSSSIARMSSITAAPRITRLSVRRNTPICFSTLAVMPAEVATNAAATNSERGQSGPIECAQIAPHTNGTITPITPTAKALPPTRFTSSSRVSSPTANSSSTTPISDSTSSGCDGVIQPNTDGPTMQPTTIWPTTSGRRIHRAIAPPICAAAKMMKTSSRIAVVSAIARCYMTT